MKDDFDWQQLLIETVAEYISPGVHNSEPLIDDFKVPELRADFLEDILKRGKGNSGDKNPDTNERY